MTKGLITAQPVRSWLNAITVNWGPPSRACRRSRDGISRIHGPHQVAQKLTSTMRPRKSDNRKSLPARSVKGISGAGEGPLRKSKVLHPSADRRGWRSIARRTGKESDENRARSNCGDGGKSDQWADLILGHGIHGRCEMSGKPSSKARASAARRKPATTTTPRRRHCPKRQRDVGRPLPVEAGRIDGKNQRLDRL